MKFIVRPGSDPFGRADGALLAAMGLPGGGIVTLGGTHVAVRPADVASPNALELGERTMANAKVTAGASVDLKRAVLPVARRVVLDGDLPIDAQAVSRALQGLPVSVGDTVGIDTSYGSDGGDMVVERTVQSVEPADAGVVAGGTLVTTQEAIDTADDLDEPPQTTAEALLAGLDAELEALTGWLTLLTSVDDLPAAWGLPKVAGVLLEGPGGVGKSELVAAAAQAAGAEVEEISVELIFKPDRLLTALEGAVKKVGGPRVIFVDRLEAIVGDDGMFRTQTAAIMRWFLDAVAERSRTAAVIGVSELGQLEPSLRNSELLPRTLSISPPDVARRRSLLAAALGQVPTHELDFDNLAARTAGFSGADILAAVVHASAAVAASGAPVTQDVMLDAISATTPSLGTTQLGEVPSYGFERVANLADVKQRLTEAVIWPMTDPDRFARLGIEPPRGILLHGPPGTGKTFVVRALAHESGAAFFAIKGAELLDKFVGESERGVREVFARARAAAPAILFFDEVDALAPVRGRSSTTVNDSVVAALLTEMDGVADRGDIVTIGATNRKDLIDPALLRAGRFEVHLELGLPAPEARRALLEITDVPFADDVDLDWLVELTEGLSFADITGAVREAALHALRRDSEALSVTAADVEAALRGAAQAAGDSGEDTGTA